MSRVVSVLALILMLLTGLVLGQMSTLGRRPMQIAATSDSGSAETARAFYRAINLYLETGDAQALQQSLAPEFVGHAPYVAGNESAESFLQYVASLRATFPGLRLAASGLSAQAGIVAMDVTLTGNTAGAFAGMPVDAGSGTSGYEVLRIEGQQIAERWGSRDLPPFYQSVIAVDMPIAAYAHPEPRIERLKFESNGFLEFIDYDGFILIAETGAMTWQVVSYPEAGADSATATPVLDSFSLPEAGASVEMAPGESIAVPAGVRFRIVNSGLGPAAALIISIRQALLSMEGSLSHKVIESIGMERIFLAGGVAPVTYEDSTRSIVVGKVGLSPGSDIPRHTTGDVELLVVIEGEIDVTVQQGQVVWSQPGKRFVAVDERQTISAGQGVGANPGAVVEFRASGDEPATLWIMTIV